MQGVLQKLTSSTIKGVIFGTLITGVIQSSLVRWLFVSVWSTPVS